MAEKKEITTSNISSAFRQMLQQETKAKIHPPTSLFTQILNDTLSNFSFSPTLKIFAPYSAGFGYVQETIMYRSENNTSTSCFRVMPIYNESKDEYTYALLVDEGALSRIFDPWPEKTAAARKQIEAKAKTLGRPLKVEELTKKQREVMRVREEDSSRTEVADLLDLFSKEYGQEEGYQRFVSALRFVLMHEILHITLAHFFRHEQLAEKFGLSGLSDEDTKNISQYISFANTQFNIVGDAFINEGLKALSAEATPILENSIRNVFKDPSGNVVSTDQIRKDYGHLYQFSMDNIGGVDSDYLITNTKEVLRDDKDLLAEFASMEKVIKDGKMLGELIEESPMALIWGAIVRKLSQDQCPSCGMPNASEDGQQASQSSGSKGNQSGQGDQSQSGQGEQSDAQDGQEQGQGSQGGQGQGTQPETCSCEYSKSNASKTVRVKLNTPSGQVSVDVTVDQNGDITDITAVNSDGAQSKLEDLETSVGRQLVEIEKSALEDMDDDERSKLRGFGSIFGRSLAKVVEQSFPWEDIVRNMVSQFPSETTKQSWLKPVIALKNHGYYYPDEDTQSNPNGHSLVFYIDSSGSVNDTQVAKAVGAVLSAPAANVKNLYLVLHDYDVADYSKSEKLVKLARQCRADRKVLKKYGVLKISLSEARNHKRKILKLLKEVVKILPEGGTSHVKPTQTLIANGFFKHELSKSKLSGFAFYTDCYSDLEQLPEILTPKCRQLGIKGTIPAVIVDCEKTSTYSHPTWPVINASGKVSKPTKKQKNTSR